MNKNQNLWLVLGTGITLVAVGCSSEGAKPTAPTTQVTSTNSAKSETAKFTAEQQGTYQTACSKQGSWGSMRTVTQIGKSDVTTSGSLYLTPDCTESPYITVKMAGIVERVGGPFGEGIEVDTRITAVTYTPGNARGVEIANETQLCDVTEWKLGVEQDVSGQTCNDEKIADVGTLDYDIIRFKGNELQMGLADADQPDARPEKLDSEVFYKVQ